MGRFAWAAGAAAVAWAVANLPAWLTGFEQWKVFWSFNADRGADLGSLWLVLVHAGHSSPPTASTVVVGAVRRDLPRDRRAGAARAARPRGWRSSRFLVVAGFLLVNKVYSPQYVLWLLPLAVLARPRWRDLLIWQAGELVYFAAVWTLPRRLAGGVRGGGAPVYDLAIWVAGRRASSTWWRSWSATSCAPSTTRSGQAGGAGRRRTAAGPRDEVLSRQADPVS